MAMSPRVPGAAHWPERLLPGADLFVASEAARNLCLIARYIRISSTKPGEVQAAQLEWLFGLIAGAIAERAFTVPAEVGAKFADFIEFLAAQMAQQDHIKGGE